MYLHSILKLLLTYILFFPLGCQRSQEKGVLHISAPSEGTYELYSIAGDSSLQYVAEHMGFFNQDLALSPGSYLVLADCSHQTVTILPGERFHTVAHKVEFIPPHPPEEGDLFSIQCSRYDGSHLKQQITNRFSFHMISGARDLLVGMLPLKIDFPQTKDLKPKVISYQLSAFQVAKWVQNNSPYSLYFISPSNDLLSITQAQTFGKWQFLLPGAYVVYVNGTDSLVNLKEKESRLIHPAGLKINTSPKIDLDLFTKIRGNPFNIELNDHHSLEVDIFYPVLPGKAKLRIDGSNRYHFVDLVENQTSQLNMKSIHVDLGCSPWEWECLGKREVSLYLSGQQYPFLESISDVPILYKNDSIEVGIEGSKGIRYRLPLKKDNLKLYVGKVKITPKPYYKPAYLTDLLRLEVLGEQFSGHSHDISSDRETTMTLIAGAYSLTRYTMISDIDRQVYKQTVYVKPGVTTHIEVPFYLPEKKAKQTERMFSLQKEKQERKAMHSEELLRPLTPM
ncbi:MAG: hypothetical protein AB8G05_15205 [Oligoflexales bacterium]